MRYYGGKQKLLGFIAQAAFENGLSAGGTVLDGFTGTSVVARHFKELGFEVTASDALYFSHCLAVSSIAFNKPPRFKNLKIDPISFLNEMPAKNGFVTNNYTPVGGRMYVTVDNGSRIDAIREQIHEWELSQEITTLEAEYLKGALIRAINLISNVSGTYAAYLKNWDSRALKPLRLEHFPSFDNERDNSVIHGDVVEAARTAEYDLAYFDPPYNARDYASNYFFLDVIAKGWFDQEPEVNGVTGMRNNSQLRSRFSSKRTASDALWELIDAANARLVILSYSDEGIIPTDEIALKLEQMGKLKVYCRPHARYRAINADLKRKQTSEYLFVLKKGDPHG